MLNHGREPLGVGTELGGFEIRVDVRPVVVARRPVAARRLLVDTGPPGAERWRTTGRASLSTESLDKKVLTRI
jgi:hypothetical protein